MLRTTRQYPTLPSLPARGSLPPIVSVVIPIGRTNLITNPSFETNTTGWTNTGGTTGTVRDTTAAYHGLYALSVQHNAAGNSGVYYSVSLTSGTPYAFSLKVLDFNGSLGPLYSVPGKNYKISIANSSGVDQAVYTFKSTGRWQWVWVFFTPTSTATYRLTIMRTDAQAGAFNIDGAQLETMSDGTLSHTTYIDGDQLGLLVGQQPPAYGWNGTPHASTSFRILQTRAGGYLVNLSMYNFLLTGLIGLGMAAPNNVSIPYTVLDGARYQRTTKPPRTFTLTGRFQADDYFTYQQSLSDMRAVLDRDLTPIQQPLVLVVEPQDECGNVIGDFANIQCIYAGGLEGNDGNYPAEDAAPTFTMYVPFLLGNDGGIGLTVQQSVSNANAIVQRSPAGLWSAMGTGMSGGTSVQALTYGLDGTLYAGGVFTDAGGSGADNIAKWNGTSWAVVRAATAINSTVADIVVGPDGRIYVTGSFTNADGIAAADGIAVYDPVGNTYAALSTGLTGGAGAGNAMMFAPDASLYVGGVFTTAGGVAAANIAKWNGSAFSALGTGTNGAVNAVVVGRNGTVYIGGSFTTAGGVSVNQVAQWNGTAWSAMAGGVPGTVESMTIGPDGSIYAGWNAGVGNAGVSKWNGTSWVLLGSTFNNSTFALLFDARGVLYAGGNFTNAAGTIVTDGIAAWNGAAWVSVDINPPGSASVQSLALRNDGTFILGYNTTGSAISSALTTATNSAPIIVYPHLTIYGPTSGTSRIYQIYNYTTGIGIWLSLTLQVGEVATFNFDPLNTSYTTTFQGDITSTLLPGSQASLFYLAPGSNSIGFFAASSTVVATLRWPTRYNGLADLVN